MMKQGWNWEGMDLILVFLVKKKIWETCNIFSVDK